MLHVYTYTYLCVVINFDRICRIRQVKNYWNIDDTSLSLISYEKFKLNAFFSWKQIGEILLYIRLYLWYNLCYLHYIEAIYLSLLCVVTADIFHRIYSESECIHFRNQSIDQWKTEQKNLNIKINQPSYMKYLWRIYTTRTHINTSNCSFRYKWGILFPKKIILKKKLEWYLVCLFFFYRYEIVCQRICDIKKI